ncbi:hypothetical protein B0H14DRAFT_3465897 [Mycena olivaceomarginata]|nr:hypothetical protein B0H14DRAFT_3465897 [Mycena olivaceomarginata]
MYRLHGALRPPGIVGCIAGVADSGDADAGGGVDPGFHPQQLSCAYPIRSTWKVEDRSAFSCFQGTQEADKTSLHSVRMPSQPDPLLRASDLPVLSILFYMGFIRHFTTGSTESVLYQRDLSHYTIINPAHCAPAVQPLRALLKVGQSTWMDSPVASPSPLPSFSCAQQYPSPVPLTPSLGCSPSSTESLSGDHPDTSISQYTIITPKPVFLTACFHAFSGTPQVCVCDYHARALVLISYPILPRLNLVDSAGLACVLAQFAQPALAHVQVVRGSTSPTQLTRPNSPSPAPLLVLSLVPITPESPAPSTDSPARGLLQLPQRQRTRCGKHMCGLYYKLDGSAHPISKSDIIHERLPHDARRGEASASVSETPSASPDVSCRMYPGHGPASSASPRPTELHPSSRGRRRTCARVHAVGKSAGTPPAVLHRQRIVAALGWLAVLLGLIIALLSPGFAMAFSPYLVIQRDGDAPSFHYFPALVARFNGASIPAPASAAAEVPVDVFGILDSPVLPAAPPPRWLGLIELSDSEEEGSSKVNIIDLTLD